MKIKLSVLDADSMYLDRLRSFFTNFYSDKVEIYTFTQESVAIDSLKTNQIDVFLANPIFALDDLENKYKGAFAYLSESVNATEYKGKNTICKYQSAEVFYKEILRLYTEKIPDSVKLKFDGVETVKVISFTSAGGGAGSSSVAAAFAIRASSQGKKVLYLNQEQFASTEAFFRGQSNFTFSDVIFAIKSKKSNLMLKLESFADTDQTGVRFFRSVKTVLDANEFNEDDIEVLLKEIRMTGAYDYVVIDVEFSFSNKCKKIFDLSNQIVLVSKGTESSNIKTIKACEAIKIQDSQKETNIFAKMKLIYNSFSSKKGMLIDANIINSIGGIPTIDNATSKEVLNIIKDNKVLDSLL